MKNSVGFVICTEKGYLESQALLFVRSLRKFGGKLKDALVVSYSPRKNFVPSRSTIKQLKKEGVEVILDDINNRFSEYGFGNKPQVCAHAELNFPADVQVFFDSDQIILKEPSELVISSTCDTKLLPVDKKGVGSNGNDALSGYWQGLFEEFEVQAPSLVMTTVTNEVIWGYWNVGLILLLQKMLKSLKSLGVYLPNSYE